MAPCTANTTQLKIWIDRIRDGDPDAREELIDSICRRMELLARRMLRRFPGVRRWEETQDVMQNALLRLLRSLQSVDPDSMRAFYGLAAQQVRRELLDLARHYRGPRGTAMEQIHAIARDRSGSRIAGRLEPEAPSQEDSELEMWCCFHESVDKLPQKERDVVSLVFYHGWTQIEVAELFEVTDRQVRRWWQSALLKLRATIDKEIPVK